MESFDDALDAATVLWAVRGMNADRVSADDVARFLAKDKTLSVEYAHDEVAVLLDSLAAEGALEFEPSTGEWSVDATLAALAADAQPAAGAPTADAFLRLRVEELERERDALGEELDDWRRRAETAEEDASIRAALTAELEEWRRRAETAEEHASSHQKAGDELRARIRELEDLLEQERVAGDERAESARRVALALSLAQHELERLEPEPNPAQAPVSRSRRAFRGNWLE